MTRPTKTPPPATAPRTVPLMFVVLLALIPATSGNVRGLFLPSLKISDVLAILLLAVVLIHWRGRWRISDGLGVTVAVYAFVYAILTLVNFSRRTDLPEGGLLKELLGVPQYLLLYLLAFAIGQRSRDIFDWLKPSLIMACGIAVIALLQFLDVGGVRVFLTWFTGNPDIADPVPWQVYRGSGLFPSWHAMGLYLCIHLVLAIALLAKGNVERRHRPLLVVSIILSGLAILSTSTGTPILIAALGILGFALTGRRLGVVLLLVAVGAAAISFSPLGTELLGRFSQQYSGDGLVPNSFWFRVDVWGRDFLPIIGDNPITGYGPVSPRDAELFAYMESMYITLLMSGGFTLLVAFAVFMVAAISRTNHIAQWKDAPSLRAAASATRYLLIALLFAMIVHPYLNDAGAAPMTFVTLGIVSGLGYQHERATRGSDIRRRAQLLAAR